MLDMYIIMSIVRCNYLYKVTTAFTIFYDKSFNAISCSIMIVWL